MILIFALALLAVCQTADADWTVADYGAVGDGKTDNTAIFQKALDEAGKAGGGVVNVPAGRFRIDGNLSVPGGVTLQGSYRVVPRGGSSDDAASQQGTALLAYAGRGSEEGKPFIRLAGSSSCIAGVIIHYPEWKRSDVPPVPYPPCIESSDTENVGVLDVQLLNPYEGIKLVRSARHIVRNIHGYPIKRGLFVDECYDIGRIENVHYWPFGMAYSPDDPFSKWVNLNGVAFEFARTDWQSVTNTFCFGYGVGYKFSEYKSGGCNGSFLGIGADSCQRAVLVEQAQPPGLLITNGEFVGRWGSSDSVCMEIGPKTAGKVSLNNCSFWGPIDRCIWMRGASGQLTAMGTNFLNWDASGTGKPCIDLDAGSAIVQGSTFALEGTHVRVGAKVRSAILMGNQAAEGFVVENGAGSRTQTLANEAGAAALSGKALLNYRVVVGAPGDGQFGRGWFGRENVGTKDKPLTMRWSPPGTRLLLPVAPNKDYTVTVEMTAPPQAVAPEAGFYLDGKRVMGFPAKGSGAVTGTVRAPESGRLTLELRCREWVPKDVIPGSQDPRTLGVQIHSVALKAKGSAGAPVVVNSQR